MDFTKAELEIINTVLRERLAQVEREWLGGIPTPHPQTLRHQLDSIVKKLEKLQRASDEPRHQA